MGWQRSVVLIGLVAILACGAPESTPRTANLSTPAVAPPALREDGGRLYLRLDAGSILRSGPAATASPQQVVASRGGALVLERDGDWYRVEVSEPPAEGWIRFAPQEARGRALRVVGTGGPRQAVEAKREVIEEARRHMQGGGRAERCGPYNLFTDVDGTSLLGACQRIGETLDAHIQDLYGTAPRGIPAESILLFDRREGFRAFAEPRGTFRAGYAAYARGSEGFLAAFVEGQPPAEVVQTLAHELAHLVLRRTFGTDLPRWLSEGLADGVGDAATVDGLRPPYQSAGVEAELQRLNHGHRAGQVSGLGRLTSMGDDQFDRGVVSYDYELSAVFIRWLLIDPERARGLRGFLSGLVGGRDYDPEALREALGRSWSELDQSLSRWIRDRA